MSTVIFDGMRMSAASGYGGKQELILDFDNNRHHAMIFSVGDSVSTVVSKLRDLAERLEGDSHLSVGRVNTPSELDLTEVVGR